MTRIIFNSTVYGWVEKKIAKYVWGDVVLEPDFRDWMENHLGQRLAGDLWLWDHYREEREVSIGFKERHHAIMFKLTWL